MGRYRGLARYSGNKTGPQNGQIDRRPWHVTESLAHAYNCASYSTEGQLGSKENQHPFRNEVGNIRNSFHARIICYNCGREGHYDRECKTLATSTHASSKNYTSQKNGKRASATANGGQRGHRSN